MMRDKNPPEPTVPSTIGNLLQYSKRSTATFTYSPEIIYFEDNIHFSILFVYYVKQLAFMFYTFITL